MFVGPTVMPWEGNDVWLRSLIGPSMVEVAHSALVPVLSVGFGGVLGVEADTSAAGSALPRGGVPSRASGSPGAQSEPSVVAQRRRLGLGRQRGPCGAADLGRSQALSAAGVAEVPLLRCCATGLQSFGDCR